MLTNNVPPPPQPAQQQTVPLHAEMITLLAQRIIQMTQTFGYMKLTNSNCSNFWDQFLATTLMIASANKVCLHKFLSLLMVSDKIE